MRGETERGKEEKKKGMERNKEEKKRKRWRDRMVRERVWEGGEKRKRGKDG